MSKISRTSAIALLIILTALVIRAGFMLNKNTYHLDEAISIALTNNNWPIVNDAGYEDSWITKTELDSRVFNCNLEKTDVSVMMGVLSAQTAVDVHPPLYYWLYAASRLLVGVPHHALAGFILNALIFILSCIILCLITLHLWDDWMLMLAVLVVFVFSSGAISLTLFLRMYELLQMLCLVFLYSAICILFPRGKEPSFLALAGLFISSCLGLLTHYYFLLFIFPVILFTVLHLTATKRPVFHVLSLLSCVTGLFLSFIIFPAMKTHLFSSYRATGSISKLSNITWATFLKSIKDYLTILSNNLLWPEALALLLILAGLVTIMTGIKKGSWLNTLKINKNVNDNTNNNKSLDMYGASNIAVAILFSGTAICVFLIIALSAPFQSARYIVPFFPVFILGYIAILKSFAKPLVAKIITFIFAILVLVCTCLHPYINQFHEDYFLDDRPAYLYNETPLIIISDHYAYKWKNLLLYKNMGRYKKLFITECSEKVGIDSLISEIMAKNGDIPVYVFVDEALHKKRRYPKIGYYGFFEVYKTHISQ